MSVTRNRKPLFTIEEPDEASGLLIAGEAFGKMVDYLMSVNGRLEPSAKHIRSRALAMDYYLRARMDGESIGEYAARHRLSRENMQRAIYRFRSDFLGETGPQQRRRTPSHRQSAAKARQLSFFKVLGPSAAFCARV